MSMFSVGCGDHQAIQDLPSDSIHVFAHLKSNDNSTGSRHTYGKDSIVGNTIKQRILTDSINIGMDINLTILELNPKITANLLAFIYEELYYPGLLEEADSILPSSTSNKLRSECTQYETVHMFLDWEYNQFFDCLTLEYKNTNDRTEYNYEIEVYPIFLNENYVTYKKYSYVHRDGVIPHERLHVHTFDRNTGEPIELNDIILPDKIKKKRERVAYHIANLDHIDSPVCSSEDFPINALGLHDSGLIFTFEQYDLSPGVYGCPVILLTTDEIRDCLKSEIYEQTIEKEEYTHWFDSLKISSPIP